MICFVLALLICSSSAFAQQKINGVNLVAPAKHVSDAEMNYPAQIHAGWIALNPYAYCTPGKPDVHFDMQGQWWGECSAGVKTMIRYAEKHAYKLMIKPHIWITHNSWAVNLCMHTEQDWRQWEKNYEKFILLYARIAENMQADLLCIGTELSMAVKERPAFWRHLIRKLRTVYNGKLTYAANWNNYQRIPFWNALDYVGVDAYFPLSDEKTPGSDLLFKAWEPHLSAMQSLADSLKKQVLFTEYGYRSTNRCAWKQWELPEYWKNDGIVNMQAQCNAYEAFFRAVWNRSWFAGGFLWKWYPEGPDLDQQNTDYTPQGKPVMLIIRKWYGELRKE